jgi:hypothetical protein
VLPLSVQVFAHCLSQAFEIDLNCGKARECKRVRYSTVDYCVFKILVSHKPIQLYTREEKGALAALADLLGSLAVLERPVQCHWEVWQDFTKRIAVCRSQACSYNLRAAGPPKLYARRRRTPSFRPDVESVGCIAAPVTLLRKQKMRGSGL